jgi:hypothetical protein
MRTELAAQPGIRLTKPSTAQMAGLLLPSVLTLKQRMLMSLDQNITIPAPQAVGYQRLVFRWSLANGFRETETCQNADESTYIALCCFSWNWRNGPFELHLIGQSEKVNAASTWESQLPRGKMAIFSWNLDRETV